jgi:opacity protein-like surface antigen
MCMRSVRTALFCAVLFLGVAPSLRAQDRVERLEFVNATIKARGQSSVPGLAVRLHLVGGAFGKNGALVPAIEYWSTSAHYPEFGIAKVSQRDWTLGADARYHFDIHKSWRPYAGGGLGLHILRSAIDPVGAPERADDSLKLGMNVLTGVDLPSVSNIQSSVEVTYHFVAGFRQFKVNWGFAVKF